MADALKFMIELVDRMTRPATTAAAAVGKLDAQLQKIRKTVGDLAAMPEVRIKAPKLVGPGGTAKPGLAPKADATGAAQVFVMNEAKRAAAVKRAAQDIDRAKRQEEAAIQRAAKEHERAANQEIKAAQRGAREVEKAQKLAQRNFEKNAQAAKKAADAQKKAFEKTSGGAFAKAFGEASKASAGFDVLGSSIGALVNPVTIATGVVLGLTVALAGLGALLLKGAGLAIAASEAKNDTLDMLEAMLGTRAAAVETQAALSAMGGELATSQTELSRLAQELSAAGVDNKNQLLASVKAISQVESVLKGAGGKVQSIIEKAVTTGKFEVEGKKLAGTGVQIQALYAEIGRRLGIGVTEVEAQMKAGKISAEVGIDAMNAVLSKKFGPLAAKQAMDFGAQMQRLKDNFGKLFEDVNTGPFLDGLSKIVKLFDSSTVSGAALKHMITTTFDSLFVAAGKAIPYVVTLFKGLVLMGLKVWNALRPLGRAISEAFGGGAEDGPKSFSDAMISAATKVGEFTTAVVNLITQEGVWETIKFMIDGVVTSVTFLIDTISFLVSSFIAVEGWILSAITWLADLGTAVTDAGTAIMDGLIAVLSDPSRLYAVVTNLAGGALDRFESVFGISSPSKEMMKMGGFVTEGLAAGIDNGAKAANDNMGNVIDLDRFRARAEAPMAPSASGGGGAGTTVVIQIGENAISINGANLTMEEVRDQFPSMFADAVELMLLSQGGGASVGRTGS